MNVILLGSFLFCGFLSSVSATTKCYVCTSEGSAIGGEFPFQYANSQANRCIYPNESVESFIVDCTGVCAVVELTDGTIRRGCSNDFDKGNECDDKDVKHTVDGVEGKLTCCSKDHCNSAPSVVLSVMVIAAAMLCYLL